MHQVISDDKCVMCDFMDFYVFAMFLSFFLCMFLVWGGNTTGDETVNGDMGYTYLFIDF
jgi:hypothetical protein